MTTMPDQCPRLHKTGQREHVALRYFRFGDIPPNQRSRNHLTGELEEGVSVYEGVLRNGEAYIILPSATHSACVSLSGCIERPCYEVRGIVIGRRGSDGEPLLKNCEIVRRVHVHGQEGMENPSDA